MLRRLTLLGSTGSIGGNVLDVVGQLPGRFQVTAMAAGRHWERLAEQAAAVCPQLLSVQDPALIAPLRQRLQELKVRPLPELMSGEAGLLACAAAADLVVAATVGVAGLPAVLEAAQRGATLAIANKETLVAAGPLILAAARHSGATILPIDSEHSAIHQCLRAAEGGDAAIERLILTASGGPFRGWTRQQLEMATVAEALRHPTWKMGGRITIDSASLMNKGLEIIEATHLFGVEERQIDVLVHPQSIVHSLVEFKDGSLLAQLGTADMRTPIQYALTYPERAPACGPRLRLEEINCLEFGRPDLKLFPSLELARSAARAGGSAPAILNAADEVAVAAFLDGKIPFLRIAEVVASVLSNMGTQPIHSLEDVLAADAAARRAATALIAPGVPA